MAWAALSRLALGRERSLSLAPLSALSVLGFWLRGGGYVGVLSVSAVTVVPVLARPCPCPCAPPLSSVIFFRVKKAHENNTPGSHSAMLAAVYGNVAAERWREPSCSLYWNASRRNGAIASRLQLPLTVSQEDMCVSGRQVVFPWHRASEVVLIPQLRLGYVVTRKCASSTMLRALEATFNADQYHCGMRAATAQCSTFAMRDTRGFRCSTACLDEQTVSEYYFFTFVRDPVERFYSAYVTAAYEADRVDGRPAASSLSARAATREIVLETLTQIRDCSPRDQHFESLTMALSSPWGSEHTTARITGVMGIRRFPPMIPMDFIGDVDRLHESFFEMLRESKRTVTSKQRDALHVHLNSSLNSRAASEGKLTPYARMAESIASIRDVKLDELVRDVYRQDVECFGYAAKRGGTRKNDAPNTRLEEPSEVAPVANNGAVIFQFDNGLRMAQRYMNPDQLARYQKNAVVLHEPEEEQWLSALLFSAAHGAVFLVGHNALALPTVQRFVCSCTLTDASTCSISTLFVMNIYPTHDVSTPKHAWPRTSAPRRATTASWRCDYGR